MTSTATQLPAPPKARRSNAASTQRVTASEWFASGVRRPYHPIAKTMLERPAGEGPAQRLHVFEKVVATSPAGADTDAIRGLARTHGVGPIHEFYG